MLIVLLGFGLACSAEQGSKENSVTTANFTVVGMSCMGCEKSIKTKLLRLDGVKEVDASHKEGRATVQYDSSKVSTDEIAAQINSLGFSAKVSGK
ncbi:MAG: heavy-metal-associated domain-containing protein [Chlorobiales bacterium]|nr:heavy-metal-associated domain-containing protein [Chlorobiales bacterium]